jgi:hypothetical protein
LPRALDTYRKYTVMYPLEHFYYGQLVHRGTPKGEMRVLAQSKDINDEHVHLVLRQGLLVANSDIPEGTWGVLRGNKQTPFLLVQAQQGRAGQSTIHAICLTSDLLRQVAGNLDAFASLLQKQMPMYEMIGDTLPPLVFSPSSERTIDQQVDDLLELMTYTGNNTRKLEPLLAAVVQNKTLVVQNAPHDHEKRGRFIQGLLTLLPSSTRFAVTFSTYNEAQSKVTPQITFMEKDFPDEAVIFDWEMGDVGGIDIDDTYSKFIVGQLRLDAELALQQAETLTPVAGWRFRSGDNLREALAYASYRSKLDESILNNLPVSVEEVSKVLSEDPTLSEELRIAYAQHLMTLSIALEDLSMCDPIAVTMQTHPELERNILTQLQDAVNNQYGSMVYEMLQMWMDNPLSPQSPEWMDLLHQSALIQADVLVQDKDIEGVVDFIQQVQRLQENNTLGDALPKIIERILPLSAESTEIASNLFLLALTTMPQASFQKLLRVRPFAQNLARPIKRFLASLARPNEPVPTGTLNSAAESFGETYRQTVLIKLLQLAYQANAYHLIDTSVLDALVDFAVTPEGINHAAMFINIYRSVEERLDTLKEPANRYLLQIPLAVGRYDLVVQGMIEQSRDYYGGERQDAYVAMVQELFGKTPMSSQQAKRALENISQKGIKGIPFIAACCGTLEATQWSVDLVHIAEESSAWLLNNPRYLEVINPAMVISLVEYYLAVNDEHNLKRMVRILPTVAAYKSDKEGLTAINRTYQLLQQDEKQVDVAFGLLRQYVREATPKPAKRAIQYFGKTMTKEQVRELNIAFNFSSFLGRLDLPTFALSLHEAVTLLQNNHESYLQKARKPSRQNMSGVIADLTPRLTLEDRKQLSRDMQILAQSLLKLGTQHQADSSSSTKVLGALIKGQENPRSALDVLRIAGGHLARGRSYPLKLTPNVIPNPFSEQDFGELTTHIGITADLLQAMAEQSDQQTVMRWEATDIAHELDNMLETFPNDEQDTLKVMGQQLQYLADLIQHIQLATDNNVLDEQYRAGKKLDTQSAEPKNVLEMYRFLYTHFAKD